MATNKNQLGYFNVSVGQELKRSSAENLGSFRQTERGAGAVGEGATGAARVWLTISLSLHVLCSGILHVVLLGSSGLPHSMEA